MCLHLRDQTAYFTAHFSCILVKELHNSWWSRCMFCCLSIAQDIIRAGAFLQLRVLGDFLTAAAPLLNNPNGGGSGPMGRVTTYPRGQIWAHWASPPPPPLNILWLEMHTFLISCSKLYLTLSLSRVSARCWSSCMWWWMNFPMLRWGLAFITDPGGCATYDLTYFADSALRFNLPIFTFQ